MLVDSEILNQMDKGNIHIAPFNPDQLGSNSYDLRLGDHLLVYTDKILDCRKDNQSKRIDIPKDGLCLLPGELYLGFSVERTTCHGVVPQVEGKSSTGRLGISIHLTAGFGDIGFDGHWTLEITVVKAIKVYPKMPIAQIFFFLPVGRVTHPYNKKESAKYSLQEATPVPSKMWKNFL